VFVGHYGASFALKAIDRRIPLWALFVAVQLLDVLWAPFVLLGIEKVRIVPGITAASPLDLYYMPYTHSLTGALLWSAIGFAIYRLWRGTESGPAAAFLVALAVFSHWVLDFVVHRPDLALYDNTAKVGLGLWNRPVLSFVLEAIVLFGGMTLYLRHQRRGRTSLMLFGCVLLGIQALSFWGPLPDSDRAIAITALAAYAVFAGVIAWWERRSVDLGPVH
jgi:membrane-bound metal-dependent hydrolase YbcI (DUF457 family)